MPIKASNMATNTANATVEYNNETVSITFYPDKFNNRIITQMDGNVEGFDKALCELIKTWDVLEDDGSMYPLTPEKLAELSFPFRVQVAKSIANIIRPNYQTA